MSIIIIFSVTLYCKSAIQLHRNEIESLRISGLDVVVFLSPGHAVSSAEALPVRLQRHAEEDRRVGVLRRDGANSIKTLQY